MSGEIFLALGCGKRNYGKKFDHIDMDDFPHVISNNIVKLPYEDNSVDLIYASHVLEYFDREDVIGVLKEWRRVLKPGGKLYLSVPDFRKMADLYLNDYIPLHRFLGPLYGRMGNEGEKIYHKTVYDYSSLGDLLRFIGFKSIDEWNLANISFDTVDDCSNARINFDPISLNLVCEK